MPDNFSSMLTINTQNSPYCVSPIPHSPNPMGLSPHWGLPHLPSVFSPLGTHHPYPYTHLNHLLTTQHMLHNNMMPHPHGMSNHVMPGLGPFHHNASTNFPGIHGLSTNSLTDSKEGSSGESLLFFFQGENNWLSIAVNDWHSSEVCFFLRQWRLFKISVEKFSSLRRRQEV